MNINKENTAIWNYASKVPQEALKKSPGSGPSLSIDGYWMIEKATELWGPIGTGWGFDIKVDRFDQGAPILHEKKLLEGEVIVLCHELTHTICISLWYKVGKEKSYVESFGHTKYLYRANSGKFITDNEAGKKSLTDAIKKALSMCGIASDIFKGKYDDADYRNQVQAEIEIEKAEDKDAEIDKKKQEIRESIKNNVDLIGTATSENEANKLAHGICITLTRKQNLSGMSDICNNGINHIQKKLAEKIKSIAEKKESK